MMEQESYPLGPTLGQVARPLLLRALELEGRMRGAEPCILDTHSAWPPWLVWSPACRRPALRGPVDKLLGRAWGPSEASMGAYTQRGSTHFLLCGA